MTKLQTGQVLGSYRIMEPVGKGGMAVVYKAYQPAMDRYVAVKVLPFQLGEKEDFAQRFLREIRVIAQLEHPNILPVYDSGEVEGMPYLVMRYLDSGTLQDRMRLGRLGLEQIDALFTQLANALGYAHSRQVIHRDIKPSNVLVTSHGDVFLTDFGLAKLVSDSVQLTLSGTITGTPWYMSPEQALGNELDERSDIYSLGVVLYEMLTGRVPFNAETPMAVILAHLHSPLPLPSAIEPEIDPAIERVLLKALAKDRQDRFANTTEFIAAWKQALQTALDNGMLLRKDQLAGDSAAPASAQPFFATPAPAPLRPVTALIDTPIPAATPQPASAPQVSVAAVEAGHKQIRLGKWQVSPWLAGILGSLLGALVLLALAFAISRLFFPAPLVQQPADAPRQELQQSPQINALRIQAIAGMLSISVEELNTAEAQGKTAGDLAVEAGMKPDDFQRLVQEKFAALLDEAVAAGTITQQDADQALTQPMFRQGQQP